LAATAAMAAPGESHQATGVKLGEATPSGVRIWTRRTKSPARRADGVQPLKNTTKAVVLPLGTDPATLEGSCPGTDGEMRVLVSTASGKRVRATEWATVGATTDYSHQFEIGGLEPDTAYRYVVETRAGSKTDGSMPGAFRTAPREDAAAWVDFAMLSCQKYSQQDAEGGFQIYDAIRAAAPHFYLSVGDNVYYDSDDPKVNDPSIARHHWHRMFSLARIVECTRAVPGYWMKDDHDSYSDDDWPGYVDEKMKPFTFEQGLKIFPEQVPLGPMPYRKFRWGKSLEIFLLEGRDYRSPHPAPDGPGKSIWGATQKKWLLDGIAGSKAHWKIVVSPTPVVGPDRPTKHDNHSNDIFTYEGHEFRRWLRDNTKNDTFVFNGDRHWQYHSVDPETKVEEFSCGAASNSHASGSPGEDPRYHRFHRVKGGFMAMKVRTEGSLSRLSIEHRDVRGIKVYGKEFEQQV
jgi:alkaline phosphatase D